MNNLLLLSFTTPRNADSLTMSAVHTFQAPKLKSANEDVITNTVLGIKFHSRCKFSSECKTIMYSCRDQNVWKGNIRFVQTV